MPLHEYRDLIGSLAGFFTIMQLFSPAFLCRDFIKRGSTDNVDVTPFIGGLVMSILFVQSTILIGDNMMLYVNIFTLGLSSLYLIIYYFYTKDKMKFYIKLGKAVIFVAVLIGYAQKESEDVVQFRFGLILTLLLTALIAAPLSSVKEIIRTKNTDSLPIPLIISGIVVAFFWLLYGVAINELSVLIQNVIGFILNAFYLVLYAYCKLTKPLKSSEKNE